ncbi:hypothetical protein J1N35_034073 [Gossypium stocksii]|uniref:Uncharacterized protein n=1 Tax=Gossypium stocksii TaxID=47602 RepID=A0A9D3URG3_9ROSI|nr:hypothetical protein J1N35_034073 [Gossypium stocksii]
MQEEHPKGAFQAKTKESSGSSYRGKKPWLEKREKRKKDVVKKWFPHAFTAKKSPHIWRGTTGTGLIFSVRVASSLVSLKRFARMKEGQKLSSKIKIRLLRIYKLKRSMLSLHLVLQPQARSKGTC